MRVDFGTDDKQLLEQDVISKLKFLSTLQPGEKIDIATLRVQGDTIVGRVYRSLLARGESRAATLEFIRQTLREAIDLATSYSVASDRFSRDLAAMVVTALSGAKVGIAALAETYKDDRMFVSRVETLVETLEAKIAAIPSMASAGSPNRAFAGFPRPPSGSPKSFTGSLESDDL